MDDIKDGELRVETELRTLRLSQFEGGITRNYYVQVGKSPTIIAHTKGNGVRTSDVTRYNKDPESRLLSGLRAAKQHAKTAGLNLVATTLLDNAGEHSLVSVAVWAKNEKALEPFYTMSPRRPIEVICLDPAPVPWEQMTPEARYVVKVGQALEEVFAEIRASR